jgi:tetratricopeptide (TPR) repeat protein
MTTFNFNKYNTILGWLAFAVALVTFTLTVEPTMSFWDCGEYISTAAKLEIGHPPGAPLYQMLGAFFAMFATSNEKIALMVNMMSVFSSAFTILFLFWSSSIILKKLVASYTEITDENSKVILGASFVGALVFTFSDSFWFNAVEAEVYAMATLLIALLLWLGLRWEQDMHQPKGNKWLLLISLVIGLSFGVHFMALLTIPSIGFLYYFKNYQKVTFKSFIIANIVIIAILLFIFKLLLPYTLAFFGKTEIFMVNSLGMPFNSGTVFAAILIVAFFYFSLKRTREKGHPFYNTAILCILFVLIGFSTWMMLPIRANADTPINENKPSDAAEVLAYYNRDQYGSNPLFYGPQFTDEFAGLDPDEPYIDKSPNYERDYTTGKYVIVNNYKKAQQNTDDAHKTLLPRMWSTDNIDGYLNFTSLPDFTVKPEYSEEKELTDVVSQFKTAFSSGKIGKDGYIQFLKSYGEYLNVEKPATIDNLNFLFEFQFGYMYVRYLLWNFVGRQNDIQGRYDNLDGNWMSGIKFIDEVHVGSQDDLPNDVLNNKGRNFYYFLPFILGLIGIMYHAQRDLKSFYVLLVLFLFTGLVLKIYLNERPFEPRERDYALVGSFYVFAIWVGFGVFAIYEMIREKITSKLIGPAVVVASIAFVPTIMAFQNWDDHDRSNRYTSIAMAKQYLDSVEPNGILYTIGDNDTFPLWYAQEIEGYRTDVKLCCTSLLMTDWYIDQMKNKTYKAEGLPISFEHNSYVGDKRDGILIQKQTENRWDIKDFINFAKSDKEETTIKTESGARLHYIPTNKIRLTVDKAAVIKNKAINPKYYDSIVPFIDIDIKGGAIYKNRLIMLDILANNDWKRPIYFSPGSYNDEDYLWMKDYLQLEGAVYKLVPVKTKYVDENYPDMGQVDTDRMYGIVSNWVWGNGESTKIYHDTETRKDAISTRNNMSRLAYALIEENKKDKAKKIIELALTKMPFEYYGYYSTLDSFADCYYLIGEKENAQKLLTKLMSKYQENLKYYKSFSGSDQSYLTSEIMTNLYRMKNLLKVMAKNDDEAFFDKNYKTYTSYAKMFPNLSRQLDE